MIRRDGDQFVLTDRGESFLESEGDANELAEWLLTRILGIDVAIVALRDDGPLTTADLAARIQACNPNWTTNYAPSSIIKWLRVAGVLDEDEERRLRLSSLGSQWATRVYWTPESLATEPGGDEAPPPSATMVGEQPVTETALPALPAIDAIVARVQARGSFDLRTIRDLDAGLWSHGRRHFAVLTGLSGTGKTLLATSYADAIGAQVCLVAVQPGWYDPGALLGYVNPLRPDAYVRTPFLEFLLAAAAEPARPYVVILDEMNLSHPEQYLAPVLSSMESGARLDLHREGEEFDGIPASTPYPCNLVLLGTVNMDETTHGLSDKVLDRAFTVEFWDVDLAAYPGWKTSGLAEEAVSVARGVLEELYVAFRPARLHFGWRTVEDVLGFLSRSDTRGSADALTAALDAVVYAKILPKLRGDDSPRFRDALVSAESVATRYELRRTAEKLLELRTDVEETGTARFWR